MKIEILERENKRTRRQRMHIRILGFIGFLLGSVGVAIINLNDFFLMAQGQIADTVLFASFLMAYKLQVRWPDFMAIALWLMPVYLWALCFYIVFSDIGKRLRFFNI
jgi:hypothetical protein